MFKKIKKLFIMLVPITLVIAGCATTGATDTDKLKAVLVTDSGGTNDKSFNQGTNEGIIDYAKEHPDKWIASQAIESKGAQDYETNLNTAANGNNVIIAAGFLMQDDIILAAEKNKETKFVGIDMDVSELDNIPKNLQAYVFADEQAGYLAGIAAGLQTKTKKVGFIGGEAVPPVQKFGWGYIAGVHAVDSDIEILYEYTGTFSDVALGAQKAQAMYNTGVDVIFGVAGGTGTGAINETMSQKQAGKDVWFIGVDRDQYEEGIIPGTEESVVLTSAVKKVGHAAQLALKEVENDTFRGGQTIKLTMDEDALGLPEKNPNLSEEQLKKLKEAEKEIKDKKIKVPNKKEEVKNKNVTGKY